ncbi:MULTISPECIES: entericidin A/B family lipoprotein [Cupriavidus]|nr:MULTISPECIES: entericidin A/B family lipoprotein [Cupriavidus]
MKYALTALACLCMLQLAGCNTVAGIGKDTKAAGHALESAASK